MNISPNSKITLRTGRTMPVLGLGTSRLFDDTAGTVQKAIELGYRMIDTSGDYGTQAGVGEGVRLSGIGRDEIFITTKIEADEDAYEATRKNLRELQMEYADLMLIHWPPRRGAGAALWQGLIRAREEGLVKDIGVSNYSTRLTDALIAEAGEVPAVNQIEWSPFGYGEAMFEYARQKRIVIQAYSPLTRAKALANAALENIAEKHGKTPAQVVLRWHLQFGTVPLPKANRTEHLKENIDIFDFELDVADMQALNALNEHFSALRSTLPYLESEQ